MPRKNYVERLQVSTDGDRTNQKNGILCEKETTDRSDLPRRRLLISVTGGSQDFYMKQSLLDSLKRGLVKVASIPVKTFRGNKKSNNVQQNAVSKHVADGRKNGVTDMVEQVNTILKSKIDPIDTCDSTDNSNASAKGNGNKVSEGEHADSSPPRPHSRPKPDDDGSVGEYGLEYCMEEALNNNQSGSSLATAIAPVMLLLVEGGRGTLKTCYEALKNGTSVVVIADSGGAAELIAFAHKNNIRSQCVSLRDEIKRLFKNELSIYMTKTDKPTEKTRQRPDERTMLHEIACAKHVDEIEKMTVQLMADKYTELLTIHRFDNDDSGHSIYKAITGTLIKAAKSEKTGTDKTKIERELELALTWNRADIARDEILTRERRNEWKEGTVRREALHAALVDDKHAFVTVILDTGFQLSYLAESEIEVLYDEAMNGPTSGIIGKLLNDKLRQKSNCSRGCTGGNQDSNRNDNQKRKSTKNGQQDELPVKLSEIHRFINKLIHHTEGQLYVQGESRSNKASTVDCPERELFLWALLLNRRQLAMIFWRAGKDHIGGALTASMLMKSLSDMVYKEGELELAGELRTNSMYFEMLATGLLNECYQLNKPVAQKLLVRRLHNWNEKTLFQLADSSMQMIFMEHSCCQTLLNEIWRGKVARAAAFWQVFTGMFCPLIPIFVMKTSDNSKTAPEKKKE